MNTTTFAFGKLSSRESVYKLSKVLGIQPLLISRKDMARIYTTDLYNNLSDLASEERSFITDPFLIADIHFLTTVMLFTPASPNACPVLPDGSRSKMFVFRGFWQVVQDTGYVGSRADWDMMPPSARAQITQFYGGQNRSTRVDLRESYITRYKLIKTIVFFFSDLNAVVTQSSNDNDTLELIHIGDEEGHNQVDYSDGVTGSSL